MDFEDDYMDFEDDYSEKPSDFTQTIGQKLLKWCSYVIVTCGAIYFHTDACNNGVGVNIFAAIIIWGVLVLLIRMEHPLYSDAVCGTLWYCFSITSIISEKPLSFLQTIGILIGFMIFDAFLLFVIKSVLQKK